MIFTKLARALAIVMGLLGLSRALIGLAVATGQLGPYDVALARYLPGSPTSGHAIDRGSLWVLLAIALGTLAEMSFAIHKRQPDKQLSN